MNGKCIAVSVSTGSVVRVGMQTQTQPQPQTQDAGMQFGLAQFIWRGVNGTWD